jgi:glucosamine--fructose-6-phosphate aminotransferase (isomerizing)
LSLPGLSGESVGETLLAEIREQPAALRRMAAASDDVAAVAEEARRRDVRHVRLVAHGTSDNAASYGVYALGLLPGWTAFRDSISLTVYYGARIDMRDSCVLALSQSGETPDVVDYVERARAGGAYTVAVSNEAGSRLMAAADARIELRAGREQAVAATKTYTSQLAALALFAAHLAGEGDRYADGIREAADLLEQALPALEQRTAALARPFAFVGRMFVIGRGSDYATAREVSLKLLETCRVAAEPLTATDMVHGPVAALDSMFPVWAIVSDDEALGPVVEAAARARETGATVVASGTQAAAVDADYALPVPRPSLPLLAPLLSVVPGQLFAWALAQAKGLDPDKPAGLSKITRARERIRPPRRSDVVTMPHLPLAISS